SEMYRTMLRVPNDTLEHLAQSVRRKRKVDEVPSVVKKEIKTEPEEDDFPRIGQESMQAPICEVKNEAIPGPNYDDLEEFIRLTDEAETGPCTREQIRKILKMEEEVKEEVKKEVVDYDEVATANQDTVSGIASNTSYAVNSQPKIEDDLNSFETEFKKEPSEYEEKPSTDFLDAPSTSAFTPTAPVQPVESPPDLSDSHGKAFKCGQCGAAFKFRYMLNLHYKSNHIIGKTINRSGAYSSVTRAPVIVWDAKKPSKDAREETTWRGHTMAEGCHFTAGGNRLLRDETECKALYMDCDECGERLGSVKAHRMHALKEHPDSPTERLCKNRDCVRMREANRQGGFNEDRPRTASEIVLVLKSINEPVQCPICEDAKHEYRSYFHLHKHYLCHHAKAFNMKFLCKACDILFDTPTKLRHHIIEKTASNERSPCLGAAGILRWPKAKK
ncbi:hypothetical protein PRIPAC_72526, partial [Pristionchus pacificus]